MTEYADEFTDLLGAYALDALEPEERERVADHVRTCPWCSAEVAAHREVAALLSSSGTVAPPGVWDRIQTELSPAAPPLRMSFTPAGEVDPLVSTSGLGVPGPAGQPDEIGEGHRRDGSDAPVVPVGSARSFSSRAVGAAMAVAASLLIVLGFVAVQQRNEADRARQEMAAATSVPPEGLSDLRVKLIGSNPDVGAQAVVNSSGEGWLVTNDLPEAGTEELYQLWGVVDGSALSLGTFDSTNEVVNFHLDPKRIDGVSAFAVTKEQAPGVVLSENDPIIAGEV
jgi:anti-sigma factor RsiW